MAKEFVGAPVLGQLNCGPSKVAVILLQLGFEAAEERECIGRGAGKTRENLVVIKAANLFPGVLDGGLAERNLSVTGKDNAAAAANGQNCCGTDQSLGWHER